MTSAAVEPKKVYTYADLADLPEDERYEIIDGELFVNPSPVTRHQKIAQRLVTVLVDALEKRRAGEVFFAPLDIVFDKKNVVQPDVLYVSRKRKAVVGERNITGAPDLVVEILSETTRRKDLTRKKALYARFAVPLYLVVDPDADRLELYRLDGKRYGNPELVESPASMKVRELGVTFDAGALFA